MYVLYFALGIIISALTIIDPFGGLIIGIALLASIYVKSFIENRIEHFLTMLLGFIIGILSQSFGPIAYGIAMLITILLAILDSL